MVPIPEGSETHSEESEYTDYGPMQEELDQPTDLRGNGGSNDAIREEQRAMKLSGEGAGCSP